MCLDLPVLVRINMIATIAKLNKIVVPRGNSGTPVGGPENGIPVAIGVPLSAETEISPQTALPVIVAVEMDTSVAETHPAPPQYSMSVFEELTMHILAVPSVIPLMWTS